MKLPYIKDGNLYDTNDKIIEKPSILVVGNRVVGYGTHGYLEYKSKLERRKLVLSGKSASAVSLIPLYEVLDLKSCSNVIGFCILGAEAFGGREDSFNLFIEDLCKLNKVRNPKRWAEERVLV